MQLDSQPEIIDQLERRQLQLDVEATALAQEKDEASRHRLAIVQAELSKIQDELQPLKLKHQAGIVVLFLKGIIPLTASRKISC